MPDAMLGGVVRLGVVQSAETEAEVVVPWGEKRCNAWGTKCTTNHHR